MKPNLSPVVRCLCGTENIIKKPDRANKQKCKFGKCKVVLWFSYLSGNTYMPYADLPVKSVDEMRAAGMPVVSNKPEIIDYVQAA